MLVLRMLGIRHVIVEEITKDAHYVFDIRNSHKTGSSATHSLRHRTPSGKPFQLKEQSEMQHRITSCLKMGFKLTCSCCRQAF